MGKFNEEDTECYYDSENNVYLSFWDEKGTCHWGLFNDDENHVSASKNLTDFMIKNAGITKQSIVLDVGCGDGEVDVQIVKEVKCTLVGIDLSGIHIQHAKQKIREQKLKNLLQFFKSSATDLKFKDNYFSHVISQSTIYHVHDKEKALSEIYRVLQKGGIFVFDDLIKPKFNISSDTKKYVYERLLFDTPFSFKTYQVQLQKTGFKVLKAIDASEHMKKTYEKLIEILQEKIIKGDNKEFHARYKYLIQAYSKTIEATNKKELGWAIYVCKKP